MWMTSVINFSLLDSSTLWLALTQLTLPTTYTGHRHIAISLLLAQDTHLTSYRKAGIKLQLRRKCLLFCQCLRPHESDQLYACQLVCQLSRWFDFFKNVFNFFFNVGPKYTTLCHTKTHNTTHKNSWVPNTHPWGTPMQNSIITNILNTIQY